MAELTAGITQPDGTPLVAPADAPEIQIRRTDTQAIVQAFTAMTEIGDGNFSFTFAPLSTLEYTFTVDADPNATGQAAPRYFFGAIGGQPDTDWTATEKEQIRFRLAMDGTQTDPTTGIGTLEDILTDTSTVEPLVSTNLDALVSSRAQPGDAMDLIVDAVDAAALATDAVAEISAGVRDVTLTGSAASSIGEALLLLRGTSAFDAFRLDNQVYDANGFLTSARLRIFPDSATAAASTQGGVGAEGAIRTVTLTGSPDGTFPQLPDDLLGVGA